MIKDKRLNIVLFFSSLGVIVGFAIALVMFFNHVSANLYVQQRMFRLILLGLQKSLNKWVLLAALAGFLAGAGVIVLTFLFRWIFKRRAVEAKTAPAKTTGFAAFVKISALVLVMLILAFNLGLFVYAAVTVSDKPNVIYIYLDALRPDHLGCYGYSRDTSPNIDRLAGRGVLFKNAYSQAPATYPSVHSTLISKYPSCIYDTGKCRLEQKHLTLAEILKNSGYYTVAVSSSPIVINSETFASMGGFEQGFDIFDRSMYDNDDYNWQWRSPEGVVNKAIEWLNKNRGKKFFLFLYIMDPHCKYHTSEPYNSLYDPDYVGKENVTEGQITPYEHKILSGENAGLDDKDIQHFVALYDGEITCADVHIKRLTDKLKQLALTDNTLIVLMSDHGEEFLEHGGVKHGYTLYNEAIRVPLIFSCPAALPQGLAIKEVVQSLDVAPTILDVLDIEEPADIQGQSLLPLMEGDNAYWRTYALSEAPYIDAKSITTKKWKYIHHFETERVPAYMPKRFREGKELYDLENDPRELSNLYSQRPDVVRRLHTQMMSALPESERERLEEKRSLELSDKTVEELKSLGYLQ